MNLIQVLFISYVFFFVLINVPVVYAVARIATYSILVLPSIILSALVYLFYDSVPSEKYSLLTTAAKSVVVWHIVMTLFTYIYFIQISIFCGSVEDHMQEKSNLVCDWNTLWMGRTLAIAIIEFQILRLIFELYPYEFLSLDCDIIAYALAASVPLISTAASLGYYLQSGNLFFKHSSKNLLYKLNIYILNNLDEPHILQARSLLYLMFIVLEAIIRLKRLWKKLKSRNNVMPFEPQNSTLQSAISFSRNINISIIVLPMFISLMLLSNIFLNGITVNTMYVANVILDWFLWVLPTYWVVSSQEILDFIKMKFSQLKSNFGYF